jgi:dihydrofolate reductase
MRKLIAGFKVSLDGKIEGAQGFADWVDAWSEDYGLTDAIDACLIGAGMYPGYEGYWSAMQAAPDTPLPMTGKLPTAKELEWARFAAKTPHYVLSTTLKEKQWANTTFLRSTDEVAALKNMPGKEIYLMGGGRLAASLLDAGLMDEFRLIVHPILAGEGKALFGTLKQRHALVLKEQRLLGEGRLALMYSCPHH